MKKIYVDMDGTVANLYGEENWLDNLQNERKGSFINLQPLVDMIELSRVCYKLMEQGYRFGVITWLPMNTSREFERVCEREKKLWVDTLMPWVSEFYVQTYGEPKQNAPIHKAARMILVDDNAEVRAKWDTVKQRISIDATKNIIKELEKLLEN